MAVQRQPSRLDTGSSPVADLGFEWFNLLMAVLTSTTTSYLSDPETGRAMRDRGIHQAGHARGGLPGADV